MESLLDVLRWVFTEMLYPRRSTTLRLFALARRDLDIKEAFSIASFQASCAREVTSPTSTALVANLFMDAHFLTRTLTSAMEVLERFLWLMLGPTQMAVNSSSAPQTLHGSTENTLCSERLQREWMSYERWRAWEVKVVAPGLRLRFPHQGLFKTILSIYRTTESTSSISSSRLKSGYSSISFPEQLQLQETLLFLHLLSQ
mmetsp:Transcript_28581/g.46380  ORF Transcript_28581/g.46380 Transcript_28581/m.46380 type:complete len:201 (-) Transcript_28581:556-1158(-)